MDLRYSAAEEQFRDELRAWLGTTLPTLGAAPPAEDWPAGGVVSAGAWGDAVAAVERSHGELRRAALALGDAHLDDRTPYQLDTIRALSRRLHCSPRSSQHLRP